MNRRKILSGAQLKYIAFTSMLIDHVNKALIYPNLNGGILLVISDIFDVLGRIAFPIFMFLLIEGYFRTTNRWKYLGIEKDSVTAWREALSFSYLIAIFPSRYLLFTYFFCRQSLPSSQHSVWYHHALWNRTDIHSSGRSWSDSCCRISDTHPSAAPRVRSHHSRTVRDLPLIEAHIHGAAD